jgi:hypothetical protein
MPINDDNIGWNRKRLWIPVNVFMGLLESTNLLTSLGAGAAVLQEAQSDSELAGLQAGADGDEIYTMLPIPWDMDLTQPMRFRVWFGHTQATADTPVFKVLYKFIAKQIALSDAGSSADETVTFTAHTNAATANALEITAWAESASETYWREGDFGILLCLEIDSLGSASANEITIMGLEIQYAVAAAPNNARRITDGQPTSSSTDPNA